ncbi:hypothetical protein BJ138DRAFT_694374 [Hygrophoropsis aurantiaca]|uniref:Uncharacterized protein n=1 Tax=Hygrophoropsis aurantiaca TaxID=72124 RepID=A0ACB8AKE2_9AGAM|nr:hypothetical protein BJ138DRAFT_694374 [Hygrophoropsis aurantiaca]
MIVTLLTFLFTASVVYSTVSVVNPLDGQLPLIARIGQNFTWSFSPETFATTTKSPISYSTSALPGWLSFDDSSMSFYGTPAAEDEGTPQITVTATDSESSATSSFYLCVTPFSAPTLQIPIEKQFYAGSSSLSSVFFLAPGSTLATQNPTLRVPPRWSFSIGLQGDTLSANNGLYYNALLDNGTPLPSWITFNTETVAFDGVAPHEDTIATPYTLTIGVHASDQQGYTAEVLPFSIVVAGHELSALSSMPTLNVTAATPFNVTLSSTADYSGILVDGQPIQPANISSLFIDVSAYKDWLRYDSFSKTIFGQPPQDLTQGKPVLPVTLTTSFNQTLNTNISLAVVSSYFSESDLGTINADPGDQVHFNLTQYFSPGINGDANLTVAFFPEKASDDFKFDPSTAVLSGTIPQDSDIAQTTVTFIAYSRITHSTSHATLNVVSPILVKKHTGSGLGSMSPAARRRLILILSIVFGIVGGILFLGITLALLRRCARVRDSALTGEEGNRAWNEGEKKWYGVGVAVSDKRAEDTRGYGYSKDADTSAASEKGSLDNAHDNGGLIEPTGYPGQQNLGLGLRRVSPRSPSVQASQRSGVMPKAEFLGRIRETARIVSDKYKRKGAPPKRPIIGAPILLRPKTIRPIVEGLPLEGYGTDTSGAPYSSDYAINANAFEDKNPQHYRTSVLTVITDSPSDSTGDRSIPRRRADFAPPRSPRGPREPNSAIIRDTGVRRSIIRESVRSTQSAGGVSFQSQTETVQTGEERPRLKPFTHATRVPVPSPSAADHAEERDLSARTTRRVASQTAKVFKDGYDVRQGSIDELRMGMHYVHTLGEGSSNVRSASDKSFSTLESSLHGRDLNNAGKAKENAISRILVRASEKFEFRIPVKSSNGTYHKLEARLVSGHPLPEFLQLELKGGDDKRVVRFYGVPTDVDVGEMHVGVFNTDSGECVARVVVEVVGRNKKSPPMTMTG